MLWRGLRGIGRGVLRLVWLSCRFALHLIAVMLAASLAGDLIVALIFAPTIFFGPLEFTFTLVVGIPLLVGIFRWAVKVGWPALDEWLGKLVRPRSTWKGRRELRAAYRRTWYRSQDRPDSVGYRGSLTDRVTAWRFGRRAARKALAEG